MVLQHELTAHLQPVKEVQKKHPGVGDELSPPPPGAWDPPHLSQVRGTPRAHPFGEAGMGKHRHDDLPHAQVSGPRAERSKELAPWKPTAGALMGAGEARARVS